MREAAGDTAGRLIGEASRLLVQGGYNGFSYADLATRFGIRKASIHHHFPAKTDLVIAAIERSRAGIRAQTALLDAETPSATAQLAAYAGYWERCIVEGDAPFCLAGVLAAELPALPEPVAAAVRGHFDDLAGWLTRILALGVEQGSLRLTASPAIEAEAFLASVYGAMLAARAFDDPGKFAVIVEASLARLRR